MAKSGSRLVLVEDGDDDKLCSCSGMRIGDLGGVLLEAAKLTRYWFCQKPGYGWVSTHIHQIHYSFNRKKNISYVKSPITQWRWFIIINYSALILNIKYCIQFRLSKRFFTGISATSKSYYWLGNNLPRKSTSSCFLLLCDLTLIYCNKILFISRFKC